MNFFVGGAAGFPVSVVTELFCGGHRRRGCWCALLTSTSALSVISGGSVVGNREQSPELLQKIALRLSVEEDDPGAFFYIDTSASVTRRLGCGWAVAAGLRVCWASGP